MLDPECCLWCQPGEAQIQPVFDKSSSKTSLYLINPHPKPCAVIKGLFMWLIQHMCGSNPKHHSHHLHECWNTNEVGWGGCERKVQPVGRYLSLDFWNHDVSALSASLTTTRLAGSCCHGWSEAFNPSSIIGEICSRTGICTGTGWEAGGRNFFFY